MLRFCLFFRFLFDFLFGCSGNVLYLCGVNANFHLWRSSEDI